MYTFLISLLSFCSLFQPARTIPTDREEDPCKDKSVRLCTVNSAEFAKCSWLKQAVISEGIEPKLNCIEGYNMWSCFDRIMKSQADIIGIDTDFTFIAKKYCFNFAYYFSIPTVFINTSCFFSSVLLIFRL